MSRLRCIIQSCGNNKKATVDLVLHYFPRTREIRQQWLKNIGMEELFLKSDSALHMYAVCNDHFEDRCFAATDKKKLIRGAVPTLNLGIGRTVPSRVPENISGIPAVHYL